MEAPMPAWRYSALLLALLSGCTSYPPALTPARGQTAAQQETDAKDCDHQVHSAARGELRHRNSPVVRRLRSCTRGSAAWALIMASAADSSREQCMNERGWIFGGEGL